MEAHLQDWLSLLLRWGHFIAGVAWIGASFYFNWLENRLDRACADGEIAGELWAVHGGGFYHLRKLAVAPTELPTSLHWFKWEAYATWLTGFALLCVVYYWNAGAYLLDPTVSAIAAGPAIAAGIGSLLLSWYFYDVLCRSPLGARAAVFSLLLVAWFALLAWALGQLLGGRAAYIHVGAAIGTVMVANVFRVIIPSQKELVRAVAERREPEATLGKRALQRSRHNNYFTLPVLFIMISSHYPATFGHPQSWAVLLAISATGILVRHWFNVRHLPGAGAWPLMVAGILLAGLVAVTAPRSRGGGALVTTAQAWAVVQQRCVSCHAANPANAAFPSAPLGVELDTQAGLVRNAVRVYLASAVNRTMPPGNLTQMTEAERTEIAGWYEYTVTGAKDE